VSEPGARDPLLETAMSVADGELPAPAEATDPGQDGAWEELAVIARLARAQRALGADAEAGAEPAADTADEGVGAAAPLFRWGTLEARRAIGRGTFGEVYAAWDPALQREVALKLRAVQDARDAATRAWIEEARSMARVRHPHVNTVYGVEVRDGTAGIWSDLVHGRTLEQLLADHGPLSARETALIGIDLCSALAAVHGAGLVHGDVKAGNVMREGGTAGARADFGRIVLMDFGSARAGGSGAAASTPSFTTPIATAPEVLDGAPLHVGSDLYALGVLLYRLVTGRYPVAARTRDELLAAHRSGARVPLRSARPGLPAAFIQVVERALARADERWRSAADMEDALAAFLGAHEPRGRGRGARMARTLARHRRSFVLAALAVAAAIAVPLVAPRVLPALARMRAGTPAAIVAREELALPGTVPNSMFGASAATGDWNGDGRADLAIGAAGDGSGGAVRIWFGGNPGTTPDLVLTGEHPSDNFGSAVANAGDVNGDGIADLIVSAKLSDIGAPDAGVAYLFLGGPRFGHGPDVTFVGRRPAGAFGYAVAGIGDINHDGFADVAVGAPDDNAAGAITGRAFVYLGGPHPSAAPALEVTSASAGSQFGFFVRGCGDLDGDGFDDFMVGANWEHTDARYAGRVYVYRGGARLSDRPAWVLSGHAPSEMFGSDGTAGDLDGDGAPDLVIGTQYGAGREKESGNAYVYFGGPRFDTHADLVLRGEKAGDLFGNFVTVLGDVNGDGIADLGVSAYASDAAGASSGRAYVYFGGPTLRDAPDVVLDGHVPGEDFGMPLLAAPDLHGDGERHLYVGAPLSGADMPWGGRAYVYDVRRYRILAPADGQAIAHGAHFTLRWAGAEPADVALSTDHGQHWIVVARHRGGHAANATDVAVPGDARTVALRVTPAHAGMPGAATIELPVH
jgi:hypothetical protein